MHGIRLTSFVDWAPRRAREDGLRLGAVCRDARQRRLARRRLGVRDDGCDCGLSGGGRRHRDAGRSRLCGLGSLCGGGLLAGEETHRSELLSTTTWACSVRKCGGREGRRIGGRLTGAVERALRRRCGLVDALRRGTTRVCLGRSEDGGGGGDGSQTESGAGAAAAAGVAGEAQARRRRSSGCSRGGSSLDESGRRGAVSPSRSRERTRCRNQPPSPSAPTSSHPNRKVSLSLPKLYQNPGTRLWQCIWLVGTPLINIKASPSPESQRAERAAGEKTQRGSADNCRGRRKNSDSSAAHTSAPIG